MVGLQQQQRGPQLLDPWHPELEYVSTYTQKADCQSAQGSVRLHQLSHLSCCPNGRRGHDAGAQIPFRLTSIISLTTSSSSTICTAISRTVTKLFGTIRLQRVALLWIQKTAICSEAKKGYTYSVGYEQTLDIIRGYSELRQMAERLELIKTVDKNTPMFFHFILSQLF